MNIDERIALWKSLPPAPVDETDGFIEMLIAERDRLKAELTMFSVQLREACEEAVNDLIERQTLAIGDDPLTKNIRDTAFAHGLREGLNYGTQNAYDRGFEAGRKVANAELNREEKK